MAEREGFEPSIRKPYNTLAGCVSSVDADGQPHARYVNFKYFFEDHLIFFSNYKSDKAKQFENNALVQSISGGKILILK